jgi:hypothetical protein
MKCLPVFILNTIAQTVVMWEPDPAFFKKGKKPVQIYLSQHGDGKCPLA